MDRYRISRRATNAIEPATDKAARPAVLGEAPYFGLMDSPNATSRLNELSVPLYAHPASRCQMFSRPTTSASPPRSFLGKLPVSEQDREKIARLNAEKLFML